MNTKDVAQLLDRSTGSHLDPIFIPSAGRTLMFKPMSTADVKTLTRISFIDQFDLNVQMIKLSLFDSLCAQDLSDTQQRDENNNIIKPAVSSRTLTQIDYLSFLIGIRQMLDNTLTYSFTCSNQQCGQQFTKVLNLDEQFSEMIYEFKPQHEFFQATDERTGHVWKFQLTNFSMYDYLYFRYMINRIEQNDEENPQVLYEMKFVKPILYIKNIWLNGQLIQDWPSLTLPNKLIFFNKIPPNITINNSSILKNETVYSKIRSVFIEQKFSDKIDDMIITCPKCNKMYGGLFSFESFFIF